MNILISNLSYLTNATQLSSLFIPYGIVISSKIVVDAVSGRSLGYGYIKMSYKAALMAISELNDSRFMNTFIEVEEASV